jgi:hypothetical protein
MCMQLLVGKPEGGENLGHLGVVLRIILKWIFKKYNEVGTWIWLFCLVIRKVAVFCQHGSGIRFHKIHGRPLHLDHLRNC